MRDDVRFPLSRSNGDAELAGDSAGLAATDVADAKLLGRIAAGEAQALSPLYARHRRRVFQFALLWTGQASSAADVTQDVFLHLLTHAHEFDVARGAVLPWLLGIARNFSRRRTGTADAWTLPDDEGDWPSPFDDEREAPDRKLAERRDVDRLRRAIAALPPHYRDVVMLVELAERSYAETALICGCELNTVRSRLSRARALLARWLNEPTSAATTPPAQ
jgi:RNA polymerase sigma-70 factor (ECF subfamily)